jgi:DNA invertase Pin-like site-specific DNA recombinase
MNKAICYVRVSTEEQAKCGVSLDMQEEKIREYCKMADLEVVSIIREEGISGSKALHSRPGGEELLKTVARGDAQHVIALKLDRLFRDAEDALRQTKAWDNAGVSLHLIDMGGQTLNTGSAMGRFFLTMAAAFAELERNMIRERTKAALSHKKGKHEVYGHTPFGFDRKGTDLVVNPNEYKVLKRIRERREAGDSFRSIAAFLNETQVPTKNGRRWHDSTIRYLLQNDLYPVLKEVKA